MHLSATDKATLYRELAKLFAADFHADRAVMLLLGQKPPPARRAFLEGLRRGLARGAGVANALEEENRALVTGLEVTLIAAGEASGRLAEPFEHLANYFQAIDAGMRQARGALIYPLILAHLGIVLPELPALLLGDAGGRAWPAILVKVAALWGIIAVLWFASRRLAALARESETMDRLLNSLPLIGRVRRHWALARFAQVFHAGLLAAMHLPRVTRMAGAASQSAVMRAGAEKAAAGIESGSPVAAALRGTAAFPPAFVDALETAEEAGSMDEEMKRWAAAETDLAGESLQRLATWLPKLAYAAIAIYVAWRIIAAFNAIYAPMNRLLEENP